MFNRKYRFKFYLNARHTMNINDVDSKIHPHTWEFVLYLCKKGEGFIEFTIIEKDIELFLAKYEGKLLNGISPFNSINPSMENIGDTVFAQINELFVGHEWSLDRLEVSENPTRTYIVSSDENPPNMIMTSCKDVSEICEGNPPASSSQNIFESESAIAEIAVADESITGFIGDFIAASPGSISESKKVSNIRYLLFGFAAVTAISVFLFFWITRNGVNPWGSDSWGHLFKARLLYDKVMSGDMLPRYSDLWYNGTQPFRYWAPLPYYVLLLFDIFTKGNIVAAYNVFIIFAFVFGAAGWILCGSKLKNSRLALVLAILWFFLPDNLRVLFSEGNIPRVMVTILFPFLLAGVLDYLENRSRKALLLIFASMFLITLCHAMISAMVGITLFLYVSWYGIRFERSKRSFIVLATALLGILLSGVWLYPALNGGMLSLSQEAVIEAVKQLTYPISQSLNPLIRLAENREAFYFGISIFAISIIGLVFGDRKSKIGFGVTLLIFAGTTKAFLPIISKIPMSQLFWMWRFTPLAMGIFFISLLLWKKLRKEILLVMLIVLVVDSAFSFKVLAFDVKTPDIEKDFSIAANVATQRIATLDLSEFGSFPSYYINFNKNKKTMEQVFGWAYQGAETAPNLSWLNIAIEKGWYSYLFDRCLELGADTLVAKKDKINDVEKFLKTANDAGYERIGETDDSIILKYPVEYAFATSVKYEGLGIGRYASNIAFIFPQFEVGNSEYIDDYSEEKLLRYKTIYLSGFKYRDRQMAENIVKKLSESGVRFVIDMTSAESDIFTSRASFLEVMAQPVEFKGKYPKLNINGEGKELGKMPEEYSSWRTMYLENLDNLNGDALFQNQYMAFLGTKYNDNLVFIGFNLPFFAVETKDGNAIEILEYVTKLKAYQTPQRDIVKIYIKENKNSISIKTEKEGVVTGIAFLDAFESMDGRMDEVHNLIYMNGKELSLKIVHPYLVPGLVVSFVGFAGFLILYILTGKRRKENDSSDMSICPKGDKVI